MKKRVRLDSIAPTVKDSAPSEKRTRRKSTSLTAKLLLLNHLDMLEVQEQLERVTLTIERLAEVGYREGQIDERTRIVEIIKAESETQEPVVQGLLRRIINQVNANAQ
jgi:hypothetical protein